MDKLSGSGFKSIAVKCNANSTVTRWLFVKQHACRERVPEKPTERTLFVLNVPPFCDEHSLRNTFKCFGDIDNVYCHSHPDTHVPPQDNSLFFPSAPKIQTYKVSYIVFKSPEGLTKALTHNSQKPLLLCSKTNPIVTGLQKWINDYNNKVIDPCLLQKEIDDFMTNFDEEERRRKMEEENGEEDEEGWIKVTRKTRKHIVPRTEAARKKILAIENKKRSRKELKNFYSFQVRESKMKQVEALRKKFEEDKKRIITFKQARKFKPF